MKIMIPMKEMMVAVVMTVSFSVNSQTMIGEINDSTVGITDSPYGCIIKYMKRGEAIRIDTTETIPVNYVHETGAFYIGTPPTIDKSRWYDAIDRTKAPMQYPSNNSNGLKKYSTYTDNLGTVTTYNNGNTWVTRVSLHSGHSYTSTYVIH